MRRSALIITVLCASIPLVVSAQPKTAKQWADSARTLVQAAQLAGDTTGLEAANEMLARALVKFPNHYLLTHWAGHAALRRANLTPEPHKKELLAMSRDYLERSIKVQPMPESYVMLSSVIGSQIAYSPERGEEMGMLANAMVDSAMRINARNPRVWLFRGISAFYTEPRWGGGMDVAEEMLRRSTALFAVERNPYLAPTWGHDEAYTWLGQVLEKQGKVAEARQAYERALDIESRNGWVRYVLLPRVTARSQ